VITCICCTLRHRLLFANFCCYNYGQLLPGVRTSCSVFMLDCSSTVVLVTETVMVSGSECHSCQGQQAAGCSCSRWSWQDMVHTKSRRSTRHQQCLLLGTTALCYLSGGDLAYRLTRCVQSTKLINAGPSWYLDGKPSQ